MVMTEKALEHNLLLFVEESTGLIHSIKALMSKIEM